MRPLKTLSFALLLALPLSAAACGGDDGNADSTGDDDGVTVPDARVDANSGTDASGGACTSPTSAGTLTPMAQAAASNADGTLTDRPEGAAPAYQAQLNADSDILSIELYTVGYFASAAPAAMTYTISGVESNYETCGLCVLLDTDLSGDPVMQPASEEGKRWIATSGTVQFTSVSGTLTGTLSNLHFVHSDIDETSFHSTAAADGCTSDVASLAFTATITADPPARGKTVSGKRHMKVQLTPGSQAKLHLTLGNALRNHSLHE